MLPSHHSGRYLIQTPAVLTSSPPSLLSGPFGLLLSAQMERDPSVTSIRAYCLYLCTKERGENPWHCGVYWLSIKWALSDDRDVIYEAEGETLCLSYVRTSLRMKAAHTERADSRLPLSPCLGAWKRGVTYPAEKSCKFMDGLSVPAYRSAMACLSGSRCRRYGQGSMALCRADAKVQWQIWHFVLEECRCAYNAGPVGKRIDMVVIYLCTFMF